MSAEQMSREYAAERRAAQAKEAQVAEVMRLADELRDSADVDSPNRKSLALTRAALEAAVRKLAGLPIQTADSETAAPAQTE